MQKIAPLDITSRKMMSKSPQKNTVTRRKFPFDPPPGLKVTPNEADILLYVNKDSGAEFEAWPEQVRNQALAEKLCERGLLRRKYFPMRYFLTAEGSNMAFWLSELFAQSERRSRDTAECKAARPS